MTSQVTSSKSAVSRACCSTLGILKPRSDCRRMATRSGRFERRSQRRLGAVCCRATCRRRFSLRVEEAAKMRVSGRFVTAKQPVDFKDLFWLGEAEPHAAIVADVNNSFLLEVIGQLQAVAVQDERLFLRLFRVQG